MREDWRVVGISGATCSGKSTLASSIKNLIPSSVLMQQDDYFLDVNDEKHIKLPELDHINFEILSSLDNDSFFENILKVLAGKLDYSPPSLSLRKYIPDIKTIPSLLLLDGFLLFNEPRIAAICDFKLFLTLNENVCWERRRLRTYDPPDPPQYFQTIVWPNYTKHFEQVKNVVQDVHYLDGAVPHDDTLAKALSIIFSKEIRI